MRSVPLRGSGWVPDFGFRFPIANWLYRQTPIGNRQLTFGNQETHPLSRGGTDLNPPGRYCSGSLFVQRTLTRFRSLINIVLPSPAVSKARLPKILFSF